MVQAVIGVIQCTCPKMASISKMAGRRAKTTEIWESGILVTHIWGTFDLVGFKVILGSIGALMSKWPVSQKRLVIKQKGLKFENQGH